MAESRGLVNAEEQAAERQAITTLEVAEDARRYICPSQYRFLLAVNNPWEYRDVAAHCLLDQAVASLKELNRVRSVFGRTVNFTIIYYDASRLI